MQDQELWDGQAGSFGLYPDDKPPRWQDLKLLAVPYDAKHPEKTITLEWMIDLVTRWHTRNPASFGTQLAETVKAWAVAQYATQDDNTSD